MRQGDMKKFTDATTVVSNETNRKKRRIHVERQARELDGVHGNRREDAIRKT